MNEASVPRLWRWAGRALLLLGGLAIALLAAEAVLRVFNPLHMRLQGDRILLPRNERRILKNTVSSRLPPEIVYSRNSLGLRGPESPRDFGSALTVIAVGGSTTESRYQSDGKTWPDLVAGILAPHFRDLWVNNAGLDGHSTYGHLLLLDQYLLSLHPSVLAFRLTIY